MFRLAIRDAQFRQDPYPFFRQMRREAPVCRIEPHGHWAVARHADVLTVLKDPRRFSSAQVSQFSSGDFLADTRGMIGTDPPHHTRLRALVSQAFGPLTVRSWEEKIRTRVRGLLNQLPGDDFDFVDCVSSPLPMLTISEILGLHSDRRQDFRRWTDTLLTWRNTPDRQGEHQENLRQMRDYFSELIEQRMRTPGDDLISGLIRASEAGARLSSDEVLGFLRLLLVAGTETTTNLISNTMLALLRHPHIAHQVQRNPMLISALVDESLRFDSPALSLSRRATQDIELGGVKIRAGELVLPLLASANHDESVFPQPERFELSRETKAALSFGHGIHFCLGAPLAKLQTRILFQEWVALPTNARRHDDEPIDYLESFFFRGPKSLRLRTT